MQTKAIFFSTTGNSLCSQDILETLKNMGGKFLQKSYYKLSNDLGLKPAPIDYQDRITQYFFLFWSINLLKYSSYCCLNIVWVYVVCFFPEYQFTFEKSFPIISLHIFCKWLHSEYANKIIANIFENFIFVIHTPKLYFKERCLCRQWELL